MFQSELYDVSKHEGNLINIEIKFQPKFEVSEMVWQVNYAVKSESTSRHEPDNSQFWLIDKYNWSFVWKTLLHDRPKPYVCKSHQNTVNLRIQWIQCQKFTEHLVILLESANFNEIHSHLLDWNRETSNYERPLAQKDNHYILFISILG